MITAAIILAEAAVIYEGMNATQSQSYGAAARGGATRSDIIISDDEINFPGGDPAEHPGLPDPGGLHHLRPDHPARRHPADRHALRQTTRKVDARQIELPMYETVMEKIGKPMVFNICVLGALLGLVPLVKEESLLSVVKDRVPKDFVAMNTAAFRLGLEMGRGYKNGN